MNKEREFRDARDATELALGTALASIDHARSHLRTLTSLARDRPDLDGLRGALELVRYALEGLMLAVGGLERRDGSPNEEQPPPG